MTKAKLFLTAFALFCFSVASSLPPGEYSTIRHPIGHAYILNDSNRFEFYNWGFLVSYTGKGNFKVIEDTLFIKFDPNPNPLAHTFQVDSIEPINKDTLLFNTTLLEVDGSSAFAAMAFVKKYYDISDSTTIRGSKGGIDGKADFTIVRPNSCFYLHVGYIGDKPDSVLLSPDYDYKIKYYFDPASKYKIYDIRDTLLIVEDYHKLPDHDWYINSNNDTIGLVNIKYINK